MTRAPSLTLLVLLASQPSLAGEATPTTAAPTTGEAGTTPAPESSPSETAPTQAIAVSADLRDEYLSGEDLLVLVTLSNTSASPVTVPDLTARPWRVKFRLTLPSGAVQNRFSTPPADEPRTTWTIPPRSQKRVLLEVPSGSALQPGAYTLGLQIDLGEAQMTVPSRPIRLAPAHPVDGDLSPAALPTERGGLDFLWLHQASSGFDLYRAVGDRSSQRLRDEFLIHLDSRIAPSMTVARSGERDRYVVWQSSPKALTYVRVQNGRVEDARRTVDLPWPRAELIGKGATDPKDNLHVPIWVPAPQGASGELRLVSVDERGQLQLRRMARLDERPTQVATVVDVAGGVHVLVARGQLLDIYVLRPDYTEDVPIPGQRLWKPEAGQQLLQASFGGAPTTEQQAGGLGVLVLYMQAGAVQAQWVSLLGKPTTRLPGMPPPAGATLVSALPHGTEAPGLLFKLEDGSYAYVEGSSGATLKALPAAPWSLIRDPDGRPVLLSLEAGRGIGAHALELSTRKP